MISEAPSTLSSMILTPFLEPGTTFPPFQLRSLNIARQPSPLLRRTFRLSNSLRVPARAACSGSCWLIQGPLACSSPSPGASLHLQHLPLPCSWPSPGGALLCAGLRANSKEAEGKQVLLFPFTPDPTNITAAAMWVLGYIHVFRGWCPFPWEINFKQLICLFKATCKVHCWHFGGGRWARVSNSTGTFAIISM